MNFQYRLARVSACLLLATAGVHAHAQTGLPSQAAADPQASVPATRYQSALDVRPPAAPAASPDRNWVASNQTVAATNSMALTMKPMAGGQSGDPHAGHAQHDHAAMQHDHAAMQHVSMKPQDSPAMCKPAGEGKMSCCESGCDSCCKSCCHSGMNGMKKDKESS
jgi:hypothetical protein